MKIEVNKQENDVLPFPKLMISGDVIILAERVHNYGSAITGTVISTGNDPSPENKTVGHYRVDFSPERFTDFKGSITLKNE